MSQVRTVSPQKQIAEVIVKSCKQNARKGKDREEKPKETEILLNMNMMALVAKHGLVSSS